MKLASHLREYWIHTKASNSLGSTPRVLDDRSRIRLDAYGSSFIGMRRTNEDCWHVGEGLGLFVVADGMGENLGGNAASTRVVDTLVHFYERAVADGADHAAAAARMAIAFRQAHLEISRAGKRVWGATAAAVRFEHGHAVLGHVGDCRIYRLREDRLDALTLDHSLDGEMARTGSDGQGPGRTLTRALGIGNEASADVRAIRVRRGDRFLMCTDGLSDVIEEPALRSYLATGTSKDAVRSLIQDAKRRSPVANVTAVVITAA